MDKVLCPWCGSEMKLEESLPYCCVYAYVCECGAVSPNECGKDKAYAAALRRPLQKPLTLEEACGSDYSFCEFRDDDEVLPAKLYHVNLGPDVPYIMHELIGQEECYSKEDNYGKTWRCWATKPSNEEREAAEWEK